MNVVISESQVAEYLELTGSGISHEAASEEAFGAFPLKSFYTLMDDGLAVAWDTCAKCHMHISICKGHGGEIIVPAYIIRWSARRRGLQVDPVTGDIREAPPMTTDVVVRPVADDYQPVGCRECGQTVTADMAAAGSYVEMGINDDATNGDYAIKQEDGHWICGVCKDKPTKGAASATT